MTLKVLVLALALALTPVRQASASVSVTVNGSSYTIPQTNEKGWGTNVTSWIQAISAASLYPGSATFALTSELDLGGSYGLKGIYYKTRTANPASAGAFRLANTDLIEWRNTANSANLALGVNTSDQLTFNGDVVPSASAALTASRALVSDGSGKVAVATTTSAEIGYVNGVTSAIQAQIDAKSPIASPTFTGTATTPNLIVSGLTATTVPYLNGSKQLTSSAVTPTELGYVSGVTSAIQTQITGKTDKSTLTTKGDIYAATAASTPARLAVGADGTVLTAASGQATGLTWTSPLTNPMTTTGDIIIGGASGAATRLAIGASTTYLKGGTSPSWSAFTAPTVQKFTTAGGSGTYTTPAGVLWIRVRMVGAGGGGGGVGGAGSTSGTGGGNTSFGSYVCAGGSGGGGCSTSTSASGGSGGSNTTGTGTLVAVAGTAGGRFGIGALTGGASPGSEGGRTPFGGSATLDYTGAGIAGIANTGAGGSGGSSNATQTYGSGGGGGGGAYQELVIGSPSATYSYAVGTGGTAGAAGSGGSAGAAGASGAIYVEEHYQ